MILDILFAVTLILAVIKGWSRGIIAGIFSLIALVLGAAAALKLSADFSLYIEDKTGYSGPAWPVVAFITIFIIVVILVRLIAKILEKAFKAAMLGGLNRLFGILFYTAAYLILFSLGIWLADQMHLIPNEAKAASRTYRWIAPAGPWVVSHLSDWIPWFKDVFQQLEAIFGKLSPLIQP